MARVPFRSELEDLFASDKSVVLKLLGGGFVGVIGAVGVVFRENDHPVSKTVKAAIIVTSAVIGVLAVLLLLLRDVVVRRVDQGERVNPLLRAYFGRGNGCLMVFLWFVTVIFATLIVTMLTTNF